MTIRTASKTGSGNSTHTPLLAGETFTGNWEMSEYDHVAVNIISDTPGVLYLDFGIPVNGSVVATFTRTVPIAAGVSYYNPLSKGAARAFRARFENAGGDQSQLAISVSYGDNLTLVTATEDNEVIVTNTERERDKFVAMRFTNVEADEYATLVDLSDTVGFPHEFTGAVHVTNSFISIDRDANTTGAIRLGVITRIDGTDADIKFIAGVAFDKSDERSIIRDRKYSPSALRARVVNGDLPDILSDFVELNVTAVNTGSALRAPNGIGTSTPAVGDLIIHALSGSGSYNSSVSITYHGHR